MNHKNKYIFILVIFTLLLSAFSSHAEIPVPKLESRVNDYANMLSPATEAQLEHRLAALEQTDATQIAVLTIPSLQGESIERFSIRVAEKWKVGQEKLDNGVLLIIARNDRKLRIEVGYGLEGKLTDLVSGQIIRNIITPEFKAGNFDQGVIDGINAMIAVVSGEYSSREISRRPSNHQGSGQGVIFGIIAFIFLISQIGRIKRPAGVAAGGILLPIFGSLFLHGGLFLFLMLIPAGLVAGLVLSAAGSAAGAHTGSSRGYYRGGGFWLGGGGGGFSSGGFGGFSGGGGGFGGGGASGGW